MHSFKELFNRAIKRDDAGHRGDAGDTFEDFENADTRSLDTSDARTEELDTVSLDADGVQTVDDTRTYNSSDDTSTEDLPSPIPEPPTSASASMDTETSTPSIPPESLSETATMETPNEHDEHESEKRHRFSDFIQKAKEFGKNYLKGGVEQKEKIDWESGSRLAGKAVIVYVARMYGVKLAHDIFIGGIQTHYTVKERRELEDILRQAQERERQTIRRTFDDGSELSRNETNDEINERLNDRLYAIMARIDNSIHLSPSQKRNLKSKLDAIIEKHQAGEHDVYRQQVDGMIAEIRSNMNARYENTGRLEVTLTTIDKAKTEFINTGLALAGFDVARAGLFAGGRAVDAMQEMYHKMRHEKGEKGVKAVVATFGKSFNQAFNNLTFGGEGGSLQKATRFATTAGSGVAIMSMVGFQSFMEDNGLSTLKDHMNRDASSGVMVENTGLDYKNTPQSHEVPASVADTVVAPADTVVAPADTVAPVAEVQPPVAEVQPPVAEVQPPVADTVAPVADTVAPVADTVAPVADTVAPVPPSIEIQNTLEAPAEAVKLGLVREGDGVSQAIARQIDKMSDDDFKALAEKYHFKGERTFTDVDKNIDHVRTGAYRTFIAKVTNDIVTHNDVFKTEQGGAFEGFDGKAIGEVSAVLVKDNAVDGGFRIDYVKSDGAPFVFDESEYNLEGGRMGNDVETTDGIETSVSDAYFQQLREHVSYEKGNETAVMGKNGELLLDEKLLSAKDMQDVHEMQGKIATAMHDADEAVKAGDVEALKHAKETLEGYDTNEGREGEMTTDISDTYFAKLNKEIEALNAEQGSEYPRVDVDSFVETNDENPVSNVPETDSSSPALKEVVIAQGKGKPITMSFERDASGKVTGIDFGTWEKMPARTIEIAKQHVAKALLVPVPEGTTYARYAKEIQEYYALTRLYENMESKGILLTNRAESTFTRIRLTELGYKLHKELSIPAK